MAADSCLYLGVPRGAARAEAGRVRCFSGLGFWPRVGALVSGAEATPRALGWGFQFRFGLSPWALALVGALSWGLGLGRLRTVSAKPGSRAYQLVTSGVLALGSVDPLVVKPGKRNALAVQMDYQAPAGPRMSD